MGCVLVTKFHVEFDVFGEWPEGELAEELWLLIDAQNVVVTEITPKIEPGWYIRNIFPNTVYYYTDENLAEAPSDFLERCTRMKPPVPWGDTSAVGEDSKYTDGYYGASNGVSYRRLDDIWSYQRPESGRWYKSAFDDSDIESPGNITFVPED